ncbi:uncharacterized protein PAF06_003086 [Gastrophryne carolinensis]
MRPIKKGMRYLICESNSYKKTPMSILHGKDGCTEQESTLFEDEKCFLNLSPFLTWARYYLRCKEALLARYAVTPEAYRRRFRESQKKGGDSYAEWACAVRVAGGAVFRLPTARVHLDWDAESGRVHVGLMDNLPAEVLLGNDLGAMTSAYATPGPASINPVTTRAQA